MPQIGATTIRPEDPPAPKGKRATSTVDWPAVLATVAAGRGKWFRVAEYDRSTVAKATAVYVGRRHNADGRFELASRTVKGVGVVYARLKVGDK